MRQLNNIHFDTIEGASAHQGEIVSSQFAPSCQKDENQMILNTEQLDYLIGETLTERVRLCSAKLDAKMMILQNKSCSDKESTRLYLFALKDKMAINKELVFINNLLTDLQDMKGGK